MEKEKKLRAIIIKKKKLIIVEANNLTKIYYLGTRDKIVSLNI